MKKFMQGLLGRRRAAAEHNNKKREEAHRHEQKKRDQAEEYLTRAGKMLKEHDETPKHRSRFSSTEIVRLHALQNREGLYEEPDEEAPNGKYKGRRIIGRDTRIDGGVYFIPKYDERLVIDGERSPGLHQAKQDMEARLYENSNTVEVLEGALQTAREHLPYDLKKTERVTDQSPRGELQDIQDYLDADAGICRHEAALAGWMIEQRIDEGRMSEKVSLDRSTIADRGGHSWARYEDEQGTSYAVDPAANYAGPIDRRALRLWDYRRPEEREAEPLMHDIEEGSRIENGRYQLHEGPAVRFQELESPGLHQAADEAMGEIRSSQQTPMDAVRQAIDSRLQVDPERVQNTIEQGGSHTTEFSLETFFKKGAGNDTMRTLMAGHMFERMHEDNVMANDPSLMITPDFGGGRPHEFVRFQDMNGATFVYDDRHQMYGNIANMPANYTTYYMGGSQNMEAA